ncbi:MAG: hypothetical protein AMXMBFR56_54740 [Polyangiaceae bacterium]
MRHLLPGRVRIAIDRDDLDTQALKLDHDLFAELTGAEEHDLGGAGREGRSESHGPLLPLSFPGVNRPARTGM